MSFYCKLDEKVQLANECTANCEKCGWNPEVNRQRREQIHKLSKQRKLREWGKNRA